MEKTLCMELSKRKMADPYYRKRVCRIDIKYGSQQSRIDENKQILRSIVYNL